MSDKTSDIMKVFSKKIGEDMLNAFQYENIFQKQEREIKGAYSKYKQGVPWYLYLFKSKIESMMYEAFKDGKAEYGKIDTVTIKRPNPYKES